MTYGGNSPPSRTPSSDALDKVFGAEGTPSTSAGGRRAAATPRQPPSSDPTVQAGPGRRAEGLRATARRRCTGGDWAGYGEAQKELEGGAEPGGEGVATKGGKPAQLSRRPSSARLVAAGAKPVATGPRLVRVPPRAVIRLRHNGAGWSSSVARWAHNPEVAGSNPVPATERRRPGSSRIRAFVVCANACAGDTGEGRVVRGSWGICV